MRGFVQERIVALDVRPRSFGFAVFEGPEVILDWGARSFRSGVNKVRVPFGPKVLRLIERYAPDKVVTRRPRTRKTERLIREVRCRARMRKTSVHVLSLKAVDASFSESNNKHQVATAISEKFPELHHILPSRRRPWESEDYRMSIFDAAALGIAYFLRKDTRDPPIVEHWPTNPSSGPGVEPK